MKKYIVIGKTTAENSAAMVNKPQDRRKIVQPLLDAFGVEMSEFLIVNHPDFNFMGVITGDSDESMQSACNIIYASGAWSLFTWYRAFESNEMKEIYEDSSQKMQSYISSIQEAGKT
tara:strand:+ start:219 stop:569 length:351 start_codon:yes stop_codon:yes gene_type:complete